MLSWLPLCHFTTVPVINKGLVPPLWGTCKYKLDTETAMSQTSSLAAIVTPTAPERRQDACSQAARRTPKLMLPKSQSLQKALFFL